MYSDFHIHSHHSFDSEQDSSEIIKKCIELNMKEMCFTDHNDFNWPIVGENADLNVKEYFNELSDLRDRYSKDINVNIGVECGLSDANVSLNRNLISTNPFDFVIGSCHEVDNMDPYYPEFFEGKTDRQAFERYFETLSKCVEDFDNFDVVGHIDYIVRYSPNKAANYSPADYSDYIDHILKTVISRGKGIEINTSALSKGFGFTNPCSDIIKRYKDLGGEIITIGSDAHKACFIGCAFDKAGDILKEIGFEYYTVFSGRKPLFRKL
jgi:histidinol-phosphatase (PHP family)